MPLIPLTENDISSIFNQINAAEIIYNPASQAQIRDKINITRDDPLIKRSLDGHAGRINIDGYDRIYVNSDIRSDYRNFIISLNNLNLIQTPVIPDIYSPRLITDTEWIPHNTLYIIVGDLVNGRHQKLN